MADILLDERLGTQLSPDRVILKRTPDLSAGTTLLAQTQRPVLEINRPSTIGSAWELASTDKVAQAVAQGLAKASKGRKAAPPVVSPVDAMAIANNGEVINVRAVDVCPNGTMDGTNNKMAFHLGRVPDVHTDPKNPVIGIGHDIRRNQGIAALVNQVADQVDGRVSSVHGSVRVVHERISGLDHAYYRDQSANGSFLLSSNGVLLRTLHSGDEVELKAGQRIRLGSNAADSTEVTYTGVNVKNSDSHKGMLGFRVKAGTFPQP